MKKIDKIFTIICICFLVLLEALILYMNISTYFAITDAMNSMPWENRQEMMNEMFPHTNWLYETLKNMAIYSIFVIVPLVLGILRFRKPENRWIQVFFYSINGLYASAIVLLFIALSMYGGVD